MTKLLTFAPLLGLACLAACQGPSTSVEIVNVSLTNAEVFHYPTVGGDEEGARISSQANHFVISEIQRDSQTNWIATYVYQPATGFVGSDQAEIEIFTGSDGGGPATHIKRVSFRFEIRD